MKLNLIKYIYELFLKYAFQSQKLSDELNFFFDKEIGHR